MVLQIAEIFYSIQGEGEHTGKPAVFVRLAGCNLNCRFCDTDYSLRAILSVDAVVAKVRELGGDCEMVILTGGEPLAQSATADLISALTVVGKDVHIESNGSVDVELPAGAWLTVSPKERLSDRMARRADEAKLIVDGRVPDEWVARFLPATPIYLQPEGNKKANVELAVAAVKDKPERFRLSLQTHKFIGIP